MKSLRIPISSEEKVLTDGLKSRADIVREVNLELIPLAKELIAYIWIFTCILWFLTISLPFLYIQSCEDGHYWTPHVIILVFIIGLSVFEIRHAKRIVKIISPLSGHVKLSKMQTLRLLMGPLGKLDIYTDFCFLAIAYDCRSAYSVYALALMIVATLILTIAQVLSLLLGKVTAFQLTEFITLFDLLGKYEYYYLGGEKSDLAKRQWNSIGRTLPLIKFFGEDIGQFIIQLLFLMEQQRLNPIVATSLCLSFMFSFIAVVTLCVKHKWFKPNMSKETEFKQRAIQLIESHQEEELKELLSKRRKFRAFEQKTRASVIKTAAISNFEVFKYIVENVLMKNDSILQSDALHEMMLNSLRYRREDSTELIRAFKYLRKEKLIYINLNRRISLSTEGSILHCLMEDYTFLLRTLYTLRFDLVQLIFFLGVDVNLGDKFGETPLSLVSRWNVNTLIRSCSSSTLKELFILNGIDQRKDEIDLAIKHWAVRMAMLLIQNGASVWCKNKKDMNLQKIAETAENEELALIFYRLLRNQPVSQ